MHYSIKCSVCGSVAKDLLAYKCWSCGGPLVVDLAADFSLDTVNKRYHGVWRYASLFPYVKETGIITLGEGGTPLVRLSGSLYFKLECLNPTGSFKDRGSTVLVSALHEMIRQAEGCLAEDSSGNAGASIAAYAARAGLPSKIYVPDAVSGPKLNQIRLYGAEVTKISGSRARVSEEAQKTEAGKFYVGHVLHPLFRDGMRSFAYELAEQFDWKLPDLIYLPVSAGTLLLGLISGFEHVRESGAISNVPTVVACQTEQISPLYHRMKGTQYSPLERITSVADALVSTNPPLLSLMVDRLKEIDGDAAMVNETEIVEAWIELARQGFYVEPSSAVAYASHKKQIRERLVSETDRAVIVLTGMGLKSNLQNPDLCSGEANFEQTIRPKGALPTHEKGRELRSECDGH